MRYHYTLPSDAATEWRPAFGYEGIYEVSSLGHVRRVVGDRNAVAGMIMAVRVSRTNDYPAVSLSRGGVCRTHFLHQIVAESFHGPRPVGMEINHKDRNKCNPAADNLEYVTRSGNRNHAYANGVVAAHGRAKPIAKLDDQTARDIYRSQELATVLAQRHGVSLSTICDIRHGRTWKHAVGTEVEA